MRKLKKKKIPGDIILHKCTKNHDHMLYCSWDMVCDKCNFYFSFWANFCFFTLLKAWKFRIFKNEKKTPWDILIKNVYHKLWSDNVQFLRYGVEGTNRWTDGWKKWHIEVGAPPKTFFLIWIKIVKNKFQ